MDTDKFSKKSTKVGDDKIEVMKNLTKDFDNDRITDYVIDFKD